MNCRDLEELLSAYADGELSRTQREFIEEHLSGCADCRETLAEFEAAGQQLFSLRHVPKTPDIRAVALSKIKATSTSSRKYIRRWLRPVTATIAIVAVITVMLVAQPWNLESSEAMAASIVRNSPEVQMALNGEEIEEVEVTTKVVDEENNVLMVLVRNEDRTVAAEVNLETKKVTEIVRVEVPDFQPGDEQKAIDIAKADPEVQELLARGGVISEVHLTHSIDITQSVYPDGSIRKEGAGRTMALLPVEFDGQEWHIVIDLQEGTVLNVGQSQPSDAMTIVHISQFVTRFVAPVLLVLGILLVSGLSFGYRRAKPIAGVAALALGIIGLFMALYSLSSIWWRQVLSVGIPAVGLIIGIADIRQRVTKRWLPIIGIVLCALALAFDLFHAIIVPSGNIGTIIGVAIVIAGIIAYAFKEQIMSIHVSGRWLRPAAVALAAVVVLIVVLVQPWSVNPQGVIAKAYSATEGLLSYRLTYFGTTSVGDETSSHHMEVMFAAPDRYHITVMNDGQRDEFIIIGDTQYVTNGSSRALIMASFGSFSSILTKEATLDILDELSDLQTLPEETIDGVKCLHYLGKLDMEKRIEENKRNLQEFNTKSGNPTITDEQKEEMFEQMRSIEVTHEIWIGKEDYLIRQLKTEQRGPVGKEGILSVSMTMRYSGFNQPVTIEPPLDSDGELLEGWQLAGSITPDSKQRVFGRNITSSIGAQEGYDDWAHQEVKYSITITNNSIETVKDVRVTIATMLTDEANKPATVEAEPETQTDVMAPGESRTYHAHYPFDASNYTKEEILKLQNKTTILVHFTTEDGKELKEVTELLFPEAPYPTKTPPAGPPAD